MKLRLKLQRQRKVENHRVKLEKGRLQKQFQRVAESQVGGMIPTQTYNRRDHLKSWDAKGVKYPESEQILKDMLLK